MDNYQLTETDYKIREELEKEFLSKKVFNTEEYLKENPKERNQIEKRKQQGISNWQTTCEGKTKKEMHDMGFFTKKQWMK